jgi:TolB protein
MKRIIAILVTFVVSEALALETLVIDKGRSDPLPIAINKFAADNNTDNITGDNIINVITSDLKNSGLFKPISRAAFIEHKMGIAHKPLFAAWRQINGNLLLNGEVQKLPSGKLKVSVILWDCVLEKDLLGEEFELPANLWRRVAHKVADKIYEKMTGDRGYFDTRVTYISESGPYLKRVKRVALMDYDGANHQFLTDGHTLVLTPRFSPKADKIMYLSYTKRAPRVYLRNLKTGADRIVGDFPGMTFAPRFSPDGSKALLSVAKNGVTQILEVDLTTMKSHTITSGIGISTSPSYSPDGTRVVFNSNRSGGRQIYTMNADGSNVQRISFGGGLYTAPAWSPRGDYIAFTKQTRGEGFTIGVMRPDGSGERIIASGYLVEGPCWAPNGRTIMFAKGAPPRNKEAGRNRIHSIDLTGYNEREVPTPKDASDPEWSKLLD